MTTTTPTIQVEDAPSAEAIIGFHEGMAPFWHPVYESARLVEGGLASVRLLGRSIVLARLDGGVVAMQDVCRHFQARLSLGKTVRIDGSPAIQCPYHGWAFGEGGKCLRIPQLAAGRPVPHAANVPGYRATERYGLIWLCLSEEPRFDIPAFPEYGDDTFRKTRLTEEMPVRTSSTRMIMGTLDDTHFPWVHEGILGDPSRPEPPAHKVWREGTELIVHYAIEQPAGIMTTDMSTHSGDAPAMISLTYTNHVGMPNVIRLAKDTPSGRYVIWLATSPVDYNVTNNFWIFARNYDLSSERDNLYLDTAAHVRLQDKPVIESQRPWLVPPFWTRVELPVGPGDLPLMEYQKWVEELGIVTAI